MAAAFAVIQAVDIVFPRLGLPDWTVTAIIVVSALGLPVILALAWAYDLKRAEAAPPGQYGHGTVSTTAVKPRRMFAYLLVSVVLIGAAAAAALLWQKRGRVDAQTLAVLPFAMRGSPNYAYLSTGMVDMLSRTFDQLAELRSADPGTVIQLAGKRDPTLPFELEQARSLAQRLNARYFVLGTVTENAGRIRIDAALHDAANDAVVGNSVRDGDAEDLFHLIDGVAAELLVDRFGAASQHLARTAATMTASPEALRSYLRGEQALRRAAYDSAVTHFQHATEADSSFALAYYRLAVTASLYDAVRISAPGALARAQQHAARLAPRDRRLLDALQSYTMGEAEEAERRYQAILAEHPDDMEAQFQLGNVLYRYNAARGRSPLEARPYYEKLFAVDPDFFCPI